MCIRKHRTLVTFGTKRIYTLTYATKKKKANTESASNLVTEGEV